MGSCPVCGCKTDELDFVVAKIGEKEEKVCSFCQRQLSTIKANAVPTEAHLRWLDAVIAKDVAQRDENVLLSLKDLRSSLAIEEPVKAAAPKTYNASEKKPSAKAEAADENQQLALLQKRVSALESEIRAMKRRQMIKTLIELGLPAVLFILILIVALSSGLFDSLKSIMDLADMSVNVDFINLNGGLLYESIVCFK